MTIRGNILRILGSAALAALSALALTSPASAQLSHDVLKIGVLTDFQSNYAGVGGKGSVIAAQMAVDDFGGTVLGKSIQLITGDTGNKADTGASLARQWYDEQGVELILDVPNSSVALAVQAIARDKNKLVIYSSPSSELLTGASCAPTGINWNYDSYAVGKALTGTLATRGSKWFFVTIDTAGGTALQTSATPFIQAAGGEVVGSVRHPAGAGDMSAVLLQAQASRAGFIALANAGSDLVTAVKQAAEFGITPAQQLVAVVLFMSDLRAMGLESGKGLKFVTAFESDSSPAAAAWTKRFYEKAGFLPNDVHAAIYSATGHYLNAVRATGTDDAQKVVEQMRATPVNDMYARNGKLRVDGRMVHDMYLVQIKSPTESKGPLDQVSLLKVIPGEEAFRPLNQSACPAAKQ